MLVKYSLKPFAPPRRCCEERAGLFKCQKRCRKQFSTLWRSGAYLCMCGKHPFTPFSPPRLAVRHVQACLSANKDWESRWCKPVYERETPYIAVFTAEVVLWSMCRPLKVPEKMEKAGFTTVKVLWSWCKPVYMWEAPYNAVFTAEEGLWSTCSPVEVPIKMEKQFSPLWKSCEAGASLFMCGKHQTTPFSPSKMGCEKRACRFKCQKRWRKQFSPLWKSCEAGASLFMCWKHTTTPFSAPRRCCEARAGLFKWQNEGESSFHYLWRTCEPGAILFMCGKHPKKPF